MTMDMSGMAYLILPFTAGGFLYISMVDLMPELLQSKPGWHGWWDIASIVTGVAVVTAALSLENEGA